VRRISKAALIAVVIAALPLSITPAHAATRTAAPAAAVAPTAAQLLAKVAGCTQISSGKFRTDEESAATIPVCGTKGSKTAPAWWKADMDIDCDGVRTSKCNENTDCCYQNDTTLHQSNGKPMQADSTRFFVIPQNSASAWHFQDAGIRLGDVAAVIYNNKVVYAVFADTGPTAIIGEASYATAQALGINPDPSNGGVDSGVTYIVFPGTRPSPVESNTAIQAKGEAAAAAFLSR